MSDGPAIDAPGDGPPDIGLPARTRVGLIGLWEFDETIGDTIADTSDLVVKVPLKVMPGSVTFSAGTMTVAGSAVIASGNAPHLDLDVKQSQAVSLEVWVKPSAASQGTAGAPATIAGLCSNINSRNISLLQADTKWVARVRTATDVPNGLPELTSVADASITAMTHLVIVSDATQRILYIDGQVAVIDPVHAPPGGWDGAYRMTLGNEGVESRQWNGTFALVAMYQQALTPAQVLVNFNAGP